jgi:hypothetical protein
MDAQLVVVWAITGMRLAYVVWAEMNTVGFNAGSGELRIARSFSVIAVKLFKLFNFFFFCTPQYSGEMELLTKKIMICTIC